MVSVVPFVMVADGNAPLAIFGYLGTLATFGYLLVYVLVSIAACDHAEPSSSSRASE